MPWSTLRTKRPMRRVSAKREREDAERATMMREQYGRHPRCQFSAFVERAYLSDQITDLEAQRLRYDRCYGAVHGHELRKSSQGGSRTDPENVVPLCDHHNGAVEDSPELYHRVGLVKWRGDD